MANTMPYTALNETTSEIRLLSILQPQYDSVSELKDLEYSPSSVEDVYCELQHYPLQDYRSPESNVGDTGWQAGKFVALSYTWGDPNDLDQINVNGYDVTVQRNLKKVLLALRSTDIIKRGYKVWCDALCVNQGDASERNHEIKRMRDIYRKCWNVVVWLGDPGNGSDDAIEFINELSQIRKEGLAATREYLKAFLAQPRGTTIWGHLSELITRPYFHRLWIIQEIAMGRNESPIICGTRMTTWENMYRVFHSLDIYRAGRQDIALTLVFQQQLLAKPEAYSAYRNVKFWMWEKVEDFQALRLAQRDQTVANKRQLMTRCRGAMCMDLLDKVYGILGLVDQRIASKVSPDYDSNVPDVYMAFSRAWIESEGTLELLTQCGESGEHYRRDETIGSWVVDLRQIIKPQVNNFIPTYNAHNETAASVKFDGPLLITKGVLLDNVDGLSGVRTDDPSCLGDIQNSQYNNRLYGDDASFTEVLWRTLVGNRDIFGNAATKAYSCILDDRLLDPSYASPTPEIDPPDTDEALGRRLHLWMTRNVEFVVQGKALREYLQSSNALEDESKTWYEALGRMNAFLWSRRLITTKLGYIGVAPRPVQRNDVIAVLWGCSAPLILRPKSQPTGKRDMYEIVANCYVQGVMDGEVVKGSQEGKYALQDIVIV